MSWPFISDIQSSCIIIVCFFYVHSAWGCLQPRQERGRVWGARREANNFVGDNLAIFVGGVFVGIFFYPLYDCDTAGGGIEITLMPPLGGMGVIPMLPFFCSLLSKKNYYFVGVPSVVLPALPRVACRWFSSCPLAHSLATGLSRLLVAALLHKFGQWGLVMVL